MLNSVLKSSINRLWDKFWSGGISNPLTAIEQISYLLFMKRLDELDIKKKQDADFTGETYKSIFEGDKNNLRWSHFKQMEGGEMLTHMQTKIFPFIKTLGNKNLDKEESPKENIFAKHMGNAVFIISKPSLLVEAVSIIDEIFEEIAKQESDGQGFQDTQGDLYEFLLSEITSAGKLGQFRTPRHIIQLICELVDPKLGDTICDPACGTGGFLLGAYQHIITAFTSKEHQKTDENGLTRGSLGDKLTNEKQWKALKEKTFYGYDMDESMVRIGLMNLMMHDIPTPNIEQKDTLSKKYDQDNFFDCIIANPPFKGSIDKGDINESLSLATTKTELLFIDRIIKSLKIGGRAGVIVPDGVLFGSSNAHKQARKMLLNDCELQGVFSMPSGVFKPYAGVSTAILIFVKGGETDKVWFYDMQSDGYTLDDKRSKLNGGGDLPDIVAKWKNRKNQTENQRNSKFFYIDKKEIEEADFDLSINRYKQSDYEEIQYEDPKIILKKIEDLEREIVASLSELKNF
jgi:type I restriction enzyme M protein